MTDKELTENLLSAIGAIMQLTGIRESGIIAIRMHPELYMTLRRELMDVQFIRDEGKKSTFMGIPIVMDVDVWLSFENRMRVGWP